MNRSDFDPALFGKRKKKVKRCPNPLFVQWLGELKEDAASKNLKSQYTYAKAQNALKKYPIVLQSGKECKILEGFGDKICKLLDDKLREHIEIFGGVTVPDDDVTDQIPTKPKKKRKDPSATCTSTSNQGAPIDGIDDFGALTIPNPPNEGNNLDAPTQRRRKRSSGTREYIPQYRSGPYALLITLYNDSREAGSRGFMTKRQLQTEAQPLADKSFTIPDPGVRYTAWSSMGTLIQKGYVIKESNPAKYSITDTGSELADRILRNAPDDVPRMQQHAADGAPPSGLSRVAGVVNGNDSQMMGPGKANANTKNNNQNTSSDVLSRVPKVAVIDLSEDDDLPLDSPGRESPPRNYSPLSLPSSPLPEIHATSTLDINPWSDSANRLLYCYIDANGQPVTSKDNAAVRIDDDVTFLIRCKYTDLLLSGLLYTLDNTRKSHDDYVYAYLSNIDSADVCTAPVLPDTKHKLSSQDVNGNNHIKSHKKSTSSTESTSAYSTSASTSSSSNKPCNYSETKTSTSTKTSHFSDSNFSDSHNSASHINPSYTSAKNKEPRTKQKESSSEYSTSLSARLKNKNPIMESQQDIVPGTSQENSQSSYSSLLDQRASSKENSQSSYSSLLDQRASSKENSQSSYSSLLDQGVSSKENSQSSYSSLLDQGISSKDSSQSSSSSSVKSLPKVNFVLQPGTFDIVLCVDNQEVYGAGSNKQAMVAELIKHGVESDVRKLQVGDFLWIAREKTKPIMGQLQLPQGRELVLDYVVERKRMDDLAGSICDGRFKEQKHRLRHCGLRKPIYLVEEHGSRQHFSIGEDALNQAITNTQVIDQFFVKQTRDTKESAAYLTVMTRYLQAHYNGKTLHACHRGDLIDYCEELNINSSKQHLMTFTEFNESSIKTKVSSVRQMFGKHLMMIHGLTNEKASAIVEKYPTPSDLFDAFEACSTVKEKETLLAPIKFGNANRCIGVAMSKQVYMLYNLHVSH